MRIDTCSTQVLRLLFEKVSFRQSQCVRDRASPPFRLDILACRLALHAQNLCTWPPHSISRMMFCLQHRDENRSFESRTIEDSLALRRAPFRPRHWPQVHPCFATTSTPRGGPLTAQERHQLNSYLCSGKLRALKDILADLFHQDCGKLHSIFLRHACSALGAVPIMPGTYTPCSRCDACISSFPCCSLR